MSVPNPHPDALLPVTTQPHHAAHGLTSALKDDTLVTAADGSRR